MKPETNRIAWGDLSYALPVVMVSWLASPLGVLQGVYAKFYGVPLATLATIILIARIFDAVTDVAVGHFSDVCGHRFGTRKPMLVVGCLLFIVSAYFLYVPQWGGEPENVSVSTLNLTLWFLLFYLGYTFFEVSHNAWASELAPRAADKSRIFSVRSIAAYIGLLLFYLVPLMPFFESSEITPQTLKWTVVSAGLLMIPALFYCVSHTPNRRGAAVRGDQVPIHLRAESQQSYFARLIQSVRFILGNRPLLLFFAFYLLIGISIGLWFGVIFLYVDVYLGMGEQFAGMFLLAFIASICITPLWYKLSLLWGKKKILALAVAFFMSSYLYTGVLDPGQVEFSELVFLKLLNTFGNSCFMAIAPAMLSQVVDYCSLKTRRQNTGVYFSLYLFFSKTGAALGGALSLAIIGWYGFDASANAQTAEAASALMIAMVWLPAGLVFLALIPLLLSPIDERCHSIIRRRLDQREQRLGRA